MEAELIDIARIGLIGMVVLMGVGSGCAAHWPEVDRKLTGSQAQFNVPPKQMVATAKQLVTDPPLSLGVQEEGPGTILTGFQSFPGEWHVARRWQERTQYRISIIPDWEEPAAKCTVQVRELTEQRAADGMKWSPAPELQRPERAAEMLKQVQQRAGK